MFDDCFRHTTEEIDEKVIAYRRLLLDGKKPDVKRDEHGRME